MLNESISKYIIRLLIINFFSITTEYKDFFGEKIENTVINQINNQLNSELSLKEIDFSLLTQFHASVDIDDLFVIEKKVLIMIYVFILKNIC